MLPNRFLTLRCLMSSWQRSLINPWCLEIIAQIKKLINLLPLAGSESRSIWWGCCQERGAEESSTSPRRRRTTSPRRRTTSPRRRSRHQRSRQDEGGDANGRSTGLAWEVLVLCLSRLAKFQVLVLCPFVWLCTCPHLSFVQLPHIENPTLHFRRNKQNNPHITPVQRFRT